MNLSLICTRLTGAQSIHLLVSPDERWFLVAKFLCLPRIAEAINAFSDGPFVMGKTLRLVRHNRRRVPTDSKDLEETFGAVVHALMLKRQTAGFVQNLKEMREPIGGSDLVLLEQ